MLAFAIAMAWLESAVVVYLRALYYPDGFAFPLVPIDRRLALAELGREAATLVMLFAPGAVLTRRRIGRFAWFCVLFGVWDLFYYVWLKVLLDWPEGLLTPDILFLIPTPWVGPVLAPCLVSLGSAVFGLLLLDGPAHDRGHRFGPLAWLLLITGACSILASFVVDPLEYMMVRGGGVWTLPPKTGGALNGLGGYVPTSFPWWLFTLGSVLAVIGIRKALVHKPERRSPVR